MLLVTCGRREVYQVSARHITDVNSEATTSEVSQLHHHHVLNRHSAPLNQILNYTFTTPEMQLRKGVTHVGSNWRLRRALRRVVHHAGATLNIGAIGGSVTCGHGASNPGVSLAWWPLWRVRYQTLCTVCNCSYTWCIHGCWSTCMCYCMMWKTAQIPLVECTLLLICNYDSSLNFTHFLQGKA